MDNTQGNEPMISEPVGAEPVGMGKEDSAGPVFVDKKKSGKGMLLGLVLCLVLAVGGIGFGVWAMMDGNARADKLNKQISTLQAQNAELMEQAQGERNNPVILNDDTLWFATAGTTSVRIKIKNGDLIECSIDKEIDRASGQWDSRACQLASFDGKIYKAVAFGSTQEFYPYVGFIMSDGSVRYFSFYGLENNEEQSLKTLNIDGKVVDSVESLVVGAKSNVFVMSDGTFIDFNESMVE